MSDFNQHNPPPYPAYNTTGLPPQKPRRSWKRPAAFIGGGLLIFIVGVGVGSSGEDSPTVSAPAVTQTVPGPTITKSIEKPGPTVTVPGPETTVTVEPKSKAAPQSSGYDSELSHQALIMAWEQQDSDTRESICTMWNDGGESLRSQVLDKVEEGAGADNPISRHDVSRFFTEACSSQVS
jgi:hypothetical protein